jgi:hypothetical protein
VAEPRVFHRHVGDIVAGQAAIGSGVGVVVTEVGFVVERLIGVVVGGAR